MRMHSDASCQACSWPFSLPAWPNIACRVYRVSLDTGCLNTKREDQSLNKLEEWAERSYLELERSQEMLNEVQRDRGGRFFDAAVALGEQPSRLPYADSPLGGGDVLAGKELWNEIAGILFPTSSLIERQVSDVQHLYEHVCTGGDVFVTLDRKGFIKNERQQALRLRGIWVFTPDEAVQLLDNLPQIAFFSAPI